MNTNLNRIKQIDIQLAWLEKVITSQRYMGAGVSVLVAIGGGDIFSNDDSLSFEFGAGGEDDVLKAMHSALMLSRNAAVTLALRELEELKKHTDLLWKNLPEPATIPSPWVGPKP